MRITVFHPANLNGQMTEFKGPFLEYRIEENGTLWINCWETATEEGSAVFAAGKWSFVCEANDKSYRMEPSS